MEQYILQTPWKVVANEQQKIFPQ